MMAEERDDDDNESAVRALNTALFLQARSLKDLHEDPLMTNSNNGNNNSNNLDSILLTNGPPLAREASNAPSDEFTLFDVEATSHVAATTSGGLAIRSDSLGEGITTGVARGDNGATSRDDANGRRTCTVHKNTWGMGRYGDSPGRVAGEEENDEEDDIVDVDDNYDNDADDGIKTELEQLRFSGLLLRQELEQANNEGSHLDMLSSNILDAAELLCLPGAPPSAVELRAHTQMDSNNHSNGKTGIGFPVNINLSQMDFVENVMDTVMDAVIEGCQGYMDEKHNHNHGRNKPSDLESASESASVSLSTSTLRLATIPRVIEKVGGPSSTIKSYTYSGDDEKSWANDESTRLAVLGLATKDESYYDSSRGGYYKSKNNCPPIVDENDMPMHIEFKKKRVASDSVVNYEVKANTSRLGSLRSFFKRANSEPPANNTKFQLELASSGNLEMTEERRAGHKEERDMGGTSACSGSDHEHEGRSGDSHNGEWNIFTFLTGRIVPEEAHDGENHLEAVDSTSHPDQGLEVEAFYQRKRRMSPWQRVRSSQQHQEWKKQLMKEWCGIKCVYWLVLVILAILVIALGIVVAVLSTTSNSSTKSPHIITHDGGTFSGSYNMGIFPPFTQEALEDPDSPQSKAYSWLLDDPLYHQYSDERKLQRFSLATLYYSTNGPGWTFANRVLNYNTDECQWFYTRTLRTTPAACAIAGGLIESLVLDHNNMKGSLPPELFLLTNLKFLSLANNEFTSFIPHQGLGKLSNLKVLDMAHSGLTGPLPSALGALTSLEQLDLSENRLTGTLPLGFANLSNLKELRLQRNNLDGSIPGAIFTNLTNLTQLYLFENSFDGSIPSEVGKLRAVEDLFLYKNSLTSSIPSEVGKLSHLQRLWLDRNILSGPLPEQFGFLQKLLQLNLYSNELSGTIPPALGNAKSLEQIRLSGNLLTGSVPDRLCALLPVGGDNDVVRILSVDCEEVTCDCGCTCTKPEVDQKLLGTNP